MKFQVIFKTSRKITIELLGQGYFYTDGKYQIYLNNEFVMSSDKVVQTIEGLIPDTAYEIRIEKDGVVSETVRAATNYEFVTLNVRRFGAKGDGVHDDTLFIQTAINCCPKDGRVLIPPGTYKVASIFLKSDVTIDLQKGAVLSAYTDRSKFPILPGLIESYDETQEYNLGTWEGNPVDKFASIITGVHISNVVLTGQGIIEGNASFENWWRDDGREKIGAFRPRTIFLNHCENVTIQGIRIQNSPSWTLHPYFSKQIRFIDMEVHNPKVSPNTDGMDPESVEGLEVVGLYFSLGDDCIAMKSGKFYMGNKYKVASRDVDIRHCFMKSGHGAVTLGSELSGGIQNLVCHECIFQDTDRGLRVKTRRGRGEDAVIDGITFENIQMDGVLTPFVVNCYYWCCDPDGKTRYVSCKEPLPVDEMTPSIRQLTFKGIEARNCHVAGTFIYGLPEAKIEEIIFEDINIDYAAEPTPEYPAMMAGVEKCTKKGIFINNVKKLSLLNVNIKGQEGPAFEVLNVEEFIKDGIQQ